VNGKIEMISVEESLYLLHSTLVSELYLPVSYLSIPDIDHTIRQYNWMVLSSEVEGWVIVRKRIVYQD
jgi:hypothetical protein